MICVLDCGTTNTKVYLLEAGGLIGEYYRKVGIKDFSGSLDRVGLKQAIREVITAAVREVGRSLAELERVILFGMITSEAGLLEIPHCPTPASRKAIAESVYVLKQQDIVDCDAQFVFIRGVRNTMPRERDIENIFRADFMRGEEAQCFGILELLKPRLPVNITVLSSHTKTIFINERGEIANSITTLSGQLFEELVTHTIIGKSVSGAVEEPGNYSLDDMVELACRCVDEGGLLRGIMVPRFMETFTATTSQERRWFLEAAICREDMKALRWPEQTGEFWSRDYIVMGQPDRTQIFEKVLRRTFGAEVNVTAITDREQIRDVTIAGASLLTNTIHNYKGVDAR